MKLKKKNVVSILALILACIMILGVVLPAVLYADTLGDLQNEQDKIDSETAEREKELEKLNDQTEELTRELGVFDSQILQTEEKLQKLNGQIRENEELLAKTQEELTEAQKKAEDYSAALTARIQRMYENNNTSYIDLLFQSESIADFFCRLEYIRQVMEYDNQIMKGLKETSRQIKEHKELIEATQASLEQDRTQAEVEQAELEAAREKKAQKLDEVKEATAEIEEKLRELASMSSDIQEKIKAAEEEIRRQEEEERRQQEANSGNGNTSVAGLSFRWPLIGWTGLSDYFGPRIHPISGIYSNHNGIDIPAYGGTDIHAIERGVVIVASGEGYWNGGYGNYIMVSHGNGYVSLYAHCSRVYVSEGQTIGKGDVIGAVGTTGNSTGNHLHLELRIDGTRVDPLDYVPR